MSNGKWVLRDTSKGTSRELDSRSEAEDTKQDLVGIGANAEDLEIIPPGGESDSDVPGVDRCVHCDAKIEDGWCPDCDGDNTETDGGSESHATTTVDDRGSASVETTTAEPEPVNDAERLPNDPDLTDDPFSWMPGDFVDTIDGTPTINRRGYAALGHKFGISAPEITVHVGPESTDHEYCRVEARVVDEDGREYVNHGSAHTDRGDDAYLLLEMATTRARKRALAGATGLGLIAVEELKNDL